jgi:hypothetical protein
MYKRVLEMNANGDFNRGGGQAALKAADIWRRLGEELQRGFNGFQTGDDRYPDV